MQKLLVKSTLLGLGLVIILFIFWHYRIRKPEPGESLRSTNVYLGWLYSGAYAGEALAAQEFDKECGIEITLRQGGVGLDPLRLVGDGAFGVASADEVLKVIANNNAPLGIVAVLNDDAPAAFATLKSSNIRSPQDFVGKRVGLLPFGSTRLIYLSLLSKLNIPRSKITEVNISPDLRPFVTGSTHDVQPVYVYDEPVTLDQRGVPYDLIIPKKYGINYKGPVYFATLSTIQKDSDLVARFLCAAMEGWRAAARDPERAITALASISPSIDKARELEVLRRALPYYISSDRTIFDSDPATWKATIDALHDFGIITTRLDPSKFLFLDQARAKAALSGK